MTSLFTRGVGLPHAEKASGCWITDVEGNEYLDAASGALVVNLGHGDAHVTSAIEGQLERVAYVHPSTFGSRVLERYAETLAGLLPMEEPAIYPVSGGSEAVETALKASRAYHLARGEPLRSVVIGRRRSYHGNTRGALDVSDRDALREPYLPWLGLAGRVPPVLEYRCPNPAHPRDCAAWHAAALESEIQRVGAHKVAAFIAEPIGGAASGAALPPDGYWDAISEVCSHYGVLIIADEVMTGFGRTGSWFASEHFQLVPDIITMAKGASSGYWPLGVCAFSGRVAEALRTGGLVHGFTFSHHLVGAAAGQAVIERIEQLGLVEGARTKGDRLRAALLSAVGDHPRVGDIRGKGLLWAVELVADRETRRPFAPADSMAQRLTAAARDRGLLVYPSTGCAGEGLGDLVIIGPPLIIEDDEIETLVSRLARAIEAL